MGAALAHVPWAQRFAGRPPLEALFAGAGDARFLT